MSTEEPLVVPADPGSQITLPAVDTEKMSTASGVSAIVTVGAPDDGNYDRLQVYLEAWVPNGVDLDRSRLAAVLESTLVASFPELRMHAIYSTRRVRGSQDVVNSAGAGAGGFGAVPNDVAEDPTGKEQD